MSFLEPGRLWLAAIPALLAVGYVVLQFRRAAFAVRFTNLDLLDRVAPRGAGWRRHLVAFGLVASLVALSMAVARPTRATEVPQELATVVLAIDSSLSMDADDVDPTRLEAAQRAATDFLDTIPDQVRVGLVSFAADAQARVAPTIDRAVVQRAIAVLDLREGTAIGEGIFASLDLIAAAAEAEDMEIPATIIVLSDGETTAGRPDEAAAAAAADQGISVSTVVFGTPFGSIVYQGQIVPVPVNEGALEEVAAETGGTFFEAGSADELSRVFDELGSGVGFVTEEREITDWFAALGLVLASLAGAGSLAWFSRLP